MQAKNLRYGVRQVVLDVQQAISNWQQAQETIESRPERRAGDGGARLSKERLDAVQEPQLDVPDAQVAASPSSD